MRGILCGPAAVVPRAAGACPRGEAADACPLGAVGAGVWPAVATTQVKRAVVPIIRRRNVENLDFVCIGKGSSSRYLGSILSDLLLDAKIDVKFEEFE